MKEETLILQRAMKQQQPFVAMGKKIITQSSRNVGTSLLK
jgi:hypothetical protein